MDTNQPLAIRSSFILESIEADSQLDASNAVVDLFDPDVGVHNSYRNHQKRCGHKPTPELLHGLSPCAFVTEAKSLHLASNCREAA